MSISDGQAVNAAITNNAFISRLVDSSAVGKIDLSEVSTTDLVDIQRIINEILDQGGLSNQAATDANAKLYSSNNAITDGDNQRVAIGKLDGNFDISTGHDHDGINSKQIDANNLLNIGDIQGSLQVFIDDAAYVTGKGSVAAVGDLYYNSTDDAIRFYDGSSSQFEELSGSINMSREVPAGLVNGANTVYTTSFIPLTNEHTAVFLDGRMLDNSEVSISGNTLTLTNAPSFGQSVFAWLVHDGVVSAITPVPGIRNVEYITLIAGDITNKFVTLANTPSTSALAMLDLIGGSSQHFGVDFTVSTNQLSWNGLVLDGILNAGDVLRINYDS